MVLSGDVREESASLRFVLGRALSAAMPHNVLRLGLPARDGRALVEALRAAFGSPEIGRRVDSHAARMAESFWQIVPARAQRRLQELLGSGGAAEYEDLVARGQQSGRRVGMFLAGDFACAARVVVAESAPHLEGLLSPQHLRSACEQLSCPGRPGPPRREPGVCRCPLARGVSAAEAWQHAVGQVQTCSDDGWRVTLSEARGFAIAAFALVTGSVLCAIAASAACITTPPPDLPVLPDQPPAIVHDAVFPTEGILTQWPAGGEFSIPVSSSEARRDLLLRGHLRPRHLEPGRSDRDHAGAGDS